MQNGFSEPEFERLYGSKALRRWRWPSGFECPVCGGTPHSEVTSRRLSQCSGCRRQTSLTAGTLFAATKLRLRLRALYHLTQSKQGISSVEPGRRLGIGQTAAWTIKQKLQQVMLERDASRRLIGRVERDDAYLGDATAGGKRDRGAAGKTPFLAAVETAPAGQPVRLMLRRVAAFSGHAIARFASSNLDPVCVVVNARRVRVPLHSALRPRRDDSPLGQVVPQHPAHALQASRTG